MLLLRAPGSEIGLALERAVVVLHARIDHALGPGDVLRERERVVHRVEAGAPPADLEIDQHAEWLSGLQRRGREAIRTAASSTATSSPSARALSAARRAILGSVTTWEKSSTPGIPASAITSASASVAQYWPSAPASICSLATGRTPWPALPR